MPSSTSSPVYPAFAGAADNPSAVHEAPVSDFIDLPTGRVHYLMQGRSGSLVVLLHANPGDSLDYAAVMPALAAHHRVIALDWPGYGRSAVPQAPGTWSALRFYMVLREFLVRM